MIGSLNGMSAYILKLRAYLFIEVEMFLRVIKVFLEVMIAEFISIFIFTVLITVYLDGVIGEMDELVIRLS